MSRHVTIFSLRYATVVLERYAKFWSVVGAACRIAALLAGSGAIAAIGAQSQPVAIAFGVVFAIAQAIEFALRPDAKSADALAFSRRYAKVWAGEIGIDDADLERAYRDIVADDHITVFRALKDLSYNQVLSEMNCPMDDAWPEGRLHRIVAMIA